MYTLSIAATVVALSGPLALAQNKEEPVRALLITGQNNHNWQYTSRVHKDTLEETGRFVVSITDGAPTALKDPNFLKQFSVLVLDYNGPRWGEPAETNFLRAVESGTGVVIIHASNNAFVGWTEYEKLCGLMWITGQTAHGDFHPFDVKYVDKDNPIVRGLPGMTAHPDELYHNLINTQKVKIDVLAEAYSSPEHKGTGKNEPMALALNYGKGRIFHTPLGHVWTGNDNQKASISDPQFKLLLARGTEWAATGKVTIGTEIADQRVHNQLTDLEKSTNWKLLFDGKTTTNWRGFKQEGFPSQGWSVRDGMLIHRAGAGGGDIITTGEYENFEFSCDWRIARNGNSGIMYHCDEAHGATWETGPEMQILDDSGHMDGKKAKTRAGTMYDVFPCAFDVCRPAGEWNHAMISVRGSQVEFNLNGFPVVKVNVDSDEYRKAIADSKWTKYPDYNTKKTGHIALQDHGDEVMFRDIKVRELK
jgi:type 1 glutamine amidotransferase